MSNPSPEALSAAERIANEIWGPDWPRDTGAYPRYVASFAALIDAAYAGLREEKYVNEYNAAYFLRHTEGEESQSIGMQRGENPHEPKTLNFEAWDDGWCCAAYKDAAYAERLGRLPVMEWFVGTPPRGGWYYFAENRKDWDLARPVAVCRHEYGNGTVEFKARIRGKEVNVETLKDGIWYGPLPKPPTPPEWLVRADLQSPSEGDAK